MNLTWSDLTVTQRRLLLRLAKAEEGYSPEDAVGLEVLEISAELLMSSTWLVRMGFVEARFGWRRTVWLRLTEAGRQVEDGGAVE